MGLLRVWLMGAVLGGTLSVASAQAVPAPHQAGTVTQTSGTGLSLTNAAGQQITVTVPDTAKILVVAPGSKDLKSATPGTLSEIAPSDKVIVTGAAGDTGTSLTAVRVILMKAAAIEQTHAAEDAAWAQGGGGIVRSVDPAAGQIVVSNGLRSITVRTTASTVIRHYAAGSIRFADAQTSTLAEIHPGDQLRVRGTKSADGSTITADEVVAGTFRHYSGLITSMDSAAGTVTLKDLATKRTVTVAVTANSDMHRLPPMVAQRVAAQMKGRQQGPSETGARQPGAEESHGVPAHAGGPASPEGESETQGAGRAGMSLSQMLSRLPVETLADLKVGDAVMIVATSGEDASRATAVTLLAGVDPILTAPSGASATLEPWSVGSAEPAEGGSAPQ